ncbi:MAG: signal peptide peptidase SppA [Phycisphaerae bacterium]|nr:signal peptide peptidase SppA [Phycisphaerae bacterium]
MKNLPVLICLSVVLTGCGGNAGYLLKPVSLDQRLTESVVQSDPGWVFSKVALIDVSGLIVNDRTGPMFGDSENPVSLFSEKLDAAARDSNVKAVVLRINSPGGTVQATETMYNRLGRFRKQSGKPVIACITDVGASGGYYLACGSQRIICQSSSITGSIGVMIQTVNFAGTMKMLGIKADAVTSGELKAMGSPLKKLTEQERQIFQDMVNEFYEQFVQVVVEGRSGLDVEKVRKLSDGRVFTGRHAVRAGLVDQLGDLQDAVADAKKAAGIRKAKVVMYHRPLGYRANVYSAAPAHTQINLINLQLGQLALLGRPGFLYLWSTDVQAVKTE